MAAFVGLVAGVLVIAGAGSLILTRNAARNQAREELVTEAQALTSSKSGTQRIEVLKLLRQTLKLEDAEIVRVDAFGEVVTSLPSGISDSDIDADALQSGETVSGRNGNLVFAVAPVALSASERNRLSLRGTLAILLTRDVGDLGPEWGYFLVAGGGALLIAALVSWQMSRRMTRPLVEAVAVTGRIAAGDLESRAPVREGDYSEFISLSHSINEMAQSLQDGRMRERHLLLSVSHDLRTPLTSIRGFAEAITDGAIDDNGKAAEVIIAESRRLERLVGDLLDLTKLEARQLSMNLRATDVAEVVSTTTEGFRPTAERSSLSVEVQVPEAGMAPMTADPDRLAQLLANLIENAITFARTTVTVTLGADPPGDGCRITVDDDGPGIAPGDLTRVFERFYRADRGPNRQVGSGLGLAIVAELAAAMGAGVRAESPLGPDGGSRFVVTMAAWRQRAAPRVALFITDS
jgi:two-component system sensor histidine kinase BaeS